MSAGDDAARAALAIARGLFSQLEQALQQAEVALGIADEPGFVSFAKAWPPADPDLNDGSWLTVQQAAFETRSSETTIRRRISREPIAVMCGGRFWIKRDRLFASL